MDKAPKAQRGFAFPGPHLMGLAPLDVWARMLWGRHGGGRRGKFGSRGGGGWRYVPRVLVGLGTSLVSTVITLPERVLLWPVLAVKFHGSRKPKIDRETVVITGYYRSGTTHLHNLMSCDRRFVTPRWVQAMAPQGWVVSWVMLRLAMLPFAPNQRPQDEVPFGAWWPAEDDFALANWSLTSPLPGRFVFPSKREEWARWHDLEGLTEKELGRWRRTLAAFCWKVCVLAPGKRLLLKTPSHTARVAELDGLTLGTARFVHVVRDADSVLRSNAKMQERLGQYALEDLVDLEEIKSQIEREFALTNEKFARESAALGGEGPRVAIVEYDQLVADPVGTLRGVYEKLGLGWDEKTERAVGEYAARVSDHRAERDRAVTPQSGANPLAPALSPTPPAGEREQGQRFDAGGSRVVGWAVAPVVAAVCLAVWLGIGWASGERFDSLVWLWGLVIGWCSLMVSKRGSRGLGIWCAVWVLVLVGAGVWPMPEVSAGWTGVDRIRNIRTAYLTKPTSVHVMLVFGIVTAYRIGSRVHARPPGR